MASITSSSSYCSVKGWVRGACIGQGSFGSVSLAFDKASKAVFAVKSVVFSDDDSRSKSSLRSLENEVMIYKLVDSPYIVSYLGDDVTRESSGEVYRNIHLEYMPGGTLTDVAKKVGECDVRSYTRCLTKALQYLHAGGIVHGDVKGRNVLIGHSPGSVKLADFGSARRLFDGRGMGEIGLTQGTPLWMAPEVVRGEPQSPESDVWSLGCTVIEMVTGEAPWKNHQRCESAEGTLFRIGFGDELPEVPEKMSKPGRDFVGKCLRRNPKERWSCEELLKHPFLSSTVETESSPRSVLELIGSEFGFDDDEEEEFDDPDGYGDVIVDPIDVKRRIEGLAMGCNVVVCWEDDSDDWEVVRGEEEENDDDDGGENHKEVVSSPPACYEIENSVRCSGSGSTVGSSSLTFDEEGLNMVKLGRKDHYLDPQVELCKPSFLFMVIIIVVEIKWEIFLVYRSRFLATSLILISFTSDVIST